MITVEISTQELERVQKALNLFSDGLKIEKLLKIAATDQIARIKVRTAEGKDFEGNPFVPYSDTYKEMRAAKGLPVDKVDLFDRGHMMAAMTWELVGYNNVRIYFSATLEAAKAHGHHFGVSPHKWGHATVSTPARPFFEISDEDKNEIAGLFSEELDKLKRKYLV